MTFFGEPPITRINLRRNFIEKKPYQPEEVENVHNINTKICVCIDEKDDAPPVDNWGDKPFLTSFQRVRKYLSETPKLVDDLHLDFAKNNECNYLIHFGQGVMRREENDIDVLYISRSVDDDVHPRFLFFIEKTHEDVLYRFLDEIRQATSPPPPVEDIVEPSVIDHLHLKFSGGGDDFCWKKTTRRKTRSLDTVFLPKAVKDGIVQELEIFFGDEKKKWLVENGFPYKRSYLFIGDPGMGKTSFIVALAGKFNRNLCFINLNHIFMTDEILREKIASMPKKSILVFEDVDTVFIDRKCIKEEGGEQKNLLTFSGVLNALDGISTPVDGHLVIMTTNYVQDLDPSLIRPGRIDKRVNFDYAKEEVLMQMVKHFYEDATEEQQRQFTQKVVAAERQFSTAFLCEYFFRCYKFSFEDFLSGFEKYLSDTDTLNQY